MDTDLSDDQLYQEGVLHLQKGEWKNAIECLERLSSRYGENEEIQALLEEVRFKAALEKEKPPVKTKRWPLLLRRWAERFLLILAVLALIAGGFLFYQSRVKPKLAESQEEAHIASLLWRGREQLASGAYKKAAQTFREALSLSSDEEAARDGLEEAKKQERLASLYEEAPKLVDQERWDEALSTLVEISQLQPGYRDVDTLLSVVRRQIKLAPLFEKAEEHYNASQWEAAIEGYEKIRALDSRYEKDIVVDHLFASYVNQGIELTSAGGALEDVEKAIKLFEKALALRPLEEKATAERKLARLYLEGRSAYEAGNVQETIVKLGEVYSEHPSCGGGAAALLLYKALVEQGDIYREEGQQELAAECYLKASRVKGVDTAIAEARMAELSPQLTPTPTPTATPTPAPTPAPTPTPLPLSSYRGKIAFLSDREGGRGIYVMDPDGSNVVKVGDLCAYYELWEEYKFSPDGIYKVYVGKGETPRLCTFSLLTGETKQITHARVDYDPSWSPKGDFIAFASEKAGNDEIYIIRPDGTGIKRLTENTWEWDKHPTWSPDGTRIAFWSNRDGGRKQIWVMNADGANPHNISSNEYNDYDPIWIR